MFSDESVYATGNIEMHQSTTGSSTLQFLNIDCTEQKAYLEMHIFTRKVHRSSIAEKAMIDFQCLQI